MIAAIQSSIATVAPPIPYGNGSGNSRIVRLRGHIHDYEWGKLGASSLVASLGTEGGESGFSPNKDHPYAELWMSTHKLGPSTLYSSPSHKLSDLVQSDPEHWLGQSLLDRWPDSRDVPFVFKVLSIAKALPLQAHPDKRLGEELNERDPSQFVDANHKPEIAVALGTPVSDAFGGDLSTTFTGFVGFAPLLSIRAALSKLPQLQRAIGDDLAIRAFLDAPSRDALKDMFNALLVRGKEWPEDIKNWIDDLLNNIATLDAGADSTLATQLALAKRINTQYPGDVGVLAAPFFMNFVRLKKGEAICIGADEVHAYLEGGPFTSLV